MAKTRSITLAGAALLAVSAAAVLGTTAGNQHASRSVPDRVARSVAAAPTGATADPTAPARTAAARPSDRGTPGPPPKGGTGSGSELLPTPAGSPSATGYRLPHTSASAPTPLLGATLPDAAVATGRLVRGFPTALGPPRGTTLVSSSVAVAGPVLQAALVTKGGDPTALVAHYRQLLTALGFTERQAQGVENLPAASFTKGKDNVTVSSRGGSTYLLANLRQKDARG